ncbi:class I SAM-dependent methyltransferase [Candidatus Amoebophilus asiaticus]|nr:class I SAM-dependent methyltransferase [Candidatus Amoebophilus asiaticus]
MPGQEEMDFTYTTIDKIFRLSMGEAGDYSGAMYNGDFSMTIEEAQRQKHIFIADSLNINNGSKVLDMACGWGPFLTYLKEERGVDGTGVNLSAGQVEACKKNGLNVHLKDCRTIKPYDFGSFDAISCIGGPEHFCSVEEWRAGKQETVYKNFFEMLNELLPVGGRFYMQTMTFSKNMLDIKDIDMNSDKNSASYVLALMVKEFPGSWLPYGEDMVIRNAAPHFKLISKSSGRLDYIETIKQWRKKFRSFNFKKYLLFLSLMPKYLRSQEFRDLVAIAKVSPNKVCFEQEIMDHYRLVFEKVKV